MKRSTLLLASVAVCCASTYATAAEINWAQVDQQLGRKVPINRAGFTNTPSLARI